MSKRGPIVIVEDDPDDQEIMQEAVPQAGASNKLVFFDRCTNAFDYLKTTPDQPFVILCDVNLPVMSGVEFKRMIDEDEQLRARSIPFIFFSTSADRKAVDVAYKELTVQGFFKKNEQFEDLVGDLKVIFDYWKICKHPNSGPRE